MNMLFITVIILVIGITFGKLIDIIINKLKPEVPIVIGLLWPITAPIILFLASIIEHINYKSIFTIEKIDL